MDHRSWNAALAALALSAFAASAAVAGDSPVAQDGDRPATAAAQPAPGAQRQRELLHLLRQDCGSCHGLRLTGGLGPPLTREALAGKPVESMAAVIFNGRPGTPMPPWRRFISAAEAQWIALQLAEGLPAEAGGAR